MTEELTPAEVTEVVKVVAEYLQGLGIVSMHIFHNGKGWQMASAKYPPAVIATALRSVADQAEAQLSERTLN